MTDLFELIASERRSTADFLDHLTDEQARHPSLCEGWEIRHVAAHLSMPLRVGLPSMFLGILRQRGDFNRFADRYAKTTADRESLHALASVIRTKADSHFTPPGLGAHAPLTDIIVHTLDMRVPLGFSDCTASQEAVDEVLAFLMTPAATRGFIPKDRVPGLSFECTDTGWSAGGGPAVRGPAWSLLLALTGRTPGLDGLDGEGVETLRRRLGG